jgi:SAM-dependent methyltransferase
MATTFDYPYESAEETFGHSYLDPVVIREIGGKPTRIFEVGCGNGAFLLKLSRLGHTVAGIEPSEQGTKIARAQGLNVSQRDAYEDLSATLGTYPVVVTLEVVEHVMWPRKFIATCRDLLEPGGRLILSTPYHGYLKNLALSLGNKWDRHMDPLWDGGHIKLWSHNTMRRLLEEAGLTDIKFRHAGRIRALAASMVVTAVKRG